MIKHGSGMALCFKYATNKVSSVAPLVVQVSHIPVCSRQLSQNSIKSPFQHECLVSSDSPSLFPSDHQMLRDSIISQEKILKSKCESDVIRYISYLIFDFEENRTTAITTGHTPPCPCSAKIFGAPFKGTVDKLELYQTSQLSKSCNGNLLLHSIVGVQNLAVNNEQKDNHEAKNSPTTNQPQDPFQPPSEEQLDLVVKKLANDLPKFFIKPLDLKIYHSNIIFEDNIRGKRFSGLVQYSFQAKLIYIFAHLRFMFVNLDVLKITSHPEDGTVKVRWKMSVVRLRKLVQLKLSDFSISMKDAKESWIEGFSTYYVMGDGLVHRHVADKVIPDRDQLLKKQQPPVPVPNPLAYSDRNKA